MMGKLVLAALAAAAVLAAAGGPTQLKQRWGDLWLDNASSGAIDSAGSDWGEAAY